LSHFFVALILLILQIYSLYKPLRSKLNLPLVISTIILLPLTLEASAGKLFSIFLTVPAILLLDQSLKSNALTQPFSYSKTGRKPSKILKTLTTTLFALLIVSIVLLSQTLMLTCIVLMGYLITILAYITYKIPKNPLEGSKKLSRVVVGDTVEVSVPLKIRAKMPSHMLLEASHPWIRLNPSSIMLEAGEEKEINLAITPPLAGPSEPQIFALAIDPWGLTQTSQILEPVELHIIPRAKYAEWLARKYLEQTAPGTAAGAAVPPSRAVRAAKIGVEYYGSRPYQPGDSLKNVDWKHTFKLQELIVKEFVGAHGQPAIIAANLTAKDPEEADDLAYNFVTSALTLAKEAVPTALAVYNHKEVIASTHPINPREALKRAMKLTRNIKVMEYSEKFLQPPDMRRLRRTISQLKQAKIEQAQKLVEILKLEYAAIQKTAGDHPASLALTKTAENAQSPAFISVVSPWNHDAEALTVTLERLESKGYNTIIVQSKTKTLKH
jgi:uncharacterized protein (DUF58 family)